MDGKFTILKDKRILKFTNFDDIPSSFQNLVSFEPDYPEPPHTDEQHDYIATFETKLQELLNRASGN